MSKNVKIFLLVIIFNLFVSSIVFATSTQNILESNIIEKNEIVEKTTNETENKNTESLEVNTLNLTNSLINNAIYNESVQEKVVENTKELKYINGVWRILINGKIDYEYTGLAENENGIYYMRNGTIKFDYYGTYYESNKAYIIEKSKVQVICNKNTTEVIQINNIWRMVKDGKVIYDYTGIGTNANGTWYVENGKVTFKYNGIYKDETGTYIIKKSQIQENCTEIMQIDGIWRMVIGGKVIYDYTGIGTNANGTYYVKDGTIKFDYYGTYYEGNKAYIIEKNKVQVICNKNTTEVIQINNIWRMVKDGKVIYDYTGIGTNANGTWYVENGKVTFKYNGIYKDETGTYIIKKSQIQENCTEIMQIDGIWRMVIGGKVIYDYTGIGTNANGTYYVKDGTIKFDYYGTYYEGNKAYIIEKNKVQVICNKNTTEVMQINNIWRMVKDGKVIYDYTGIGTNANGTYYVKDGTIKFDYYGTYYEGDKAYIIEKNKVQVICNKNTTEVIQINNIWRMVINGEIDYQYTGLGNNSFGTWYVENGKVTFKYNGIYKDETGTYVIEGSKLKTDCTKVMRLDGIWRMVVKGKVDYTYTGIGSNEYGEWYIKDGEVRFDFTGTYFEENTAYIIEGGQVKAKVNKDIAEVVKINDIWRMVINGKIDYQYTGLGNNSFGTWYVENGKVTFKYNGIYKDETGTYVIEGSKLKTDCTKVMRLDGIWRMIVKGKVDYTYTGIGSNEYGEWYIKDGEVKFDYTGTYFEGNKAFIIEAGMVRAICTSNTTGVMKINETWRMVINGVVDYKYNGLGKNEFGTWIIQNGEVNFAYTGKFTDSDGSIYNIVKGEVREVINNSSYPGTMWVDRPINGNNYQQGNLEISGWALSESEEDIVKIYLDDKFVGNATRQSRPDVFEMYKNEYGGIALNPLPGYYYKLNTAGLSNGKHTIKIVNLTKDSKTVIQSREVEFKIVNLAKTWGIDVSQYQGNINWNAVKNSGVNFAILRIGYYLESKGTTVIDPYFEQNYNECKRLGIAVGGYFYSYAFNSVEASHEASACLSVINGKSFEMPIFLDVEDNILKNGVANGKTNKDELTNASITFCDIMNGAGYRGGVYASKNFFRDYLNVSVLERYNIWLAHYTTATDYNGRYDMWQYTNAGSIPGINGNVDLNWCFTRYY